MVNRQQRDLKNEFTSSKVAKKITIKNATPDNTIHPVTPAGHQEGIEPK
jgi:hypothetical protein